ncbi:MAG TPA: acetylglutamate kinase [Thermoanaerobaculia bacterium]|nr:acetylglutamate kinase [Thermoanaerobaculia bacterium]
MKIENGPWVVKLGGSLLENEGRRRRALAAIARAWNEGTPLVVVHGGGRKIDEHLAALGLTRSVHRGLRVTGPATLEAVVAVLAGIVNKSLVEELRGLGISAAGISGVDGATIVAERHPPLDGVELGRVGTAPHARPDVLTVLLSAGLLPVLAPIAAGRDGGILNLNADAAAAAVACSLASPRLVFFTDVEGVRDGAGRTLSRLSAAAARELIESGAASGGMRPKLAAALAALADGVGEIVIAGPDRHADVLDGRHGGTSLVAA